MTLTPIVCMTLLAVSAGPEPARPDYRAFLLTAPADTPEAKHGYRRLLITRMDIVSIAERKLADPTPGTRLPVAVLDAGAFTFQTYMTEALWDEPFHVVTFDAADAGKKTLTIEKVTYTYEPLPIQDVIRLMEDPYGKAFLHRHRHPLEGADLTARAFALLLREQVREKGK